MTNHQAHTHLIGLVSAINLLLAKKEFNTNNLRHQELVSDAANLQSYLYDLPASVFKREILSRIAVDGIIDNVVIVDTIKRRVSAEQRYEETRLSNFMTSSKLEDTLPD